MPRYCYRCELCKKEFIIRHRTLEIQSDCPECEEENSLKKLLSKPLHTTRKGLPTQKVGDLTEKYIEENREILKNQKEEAKSQNHEPT